MLILFDTSHDLDVCQVESGEEVGTLLTPLTRYTLKRPDLPWAIDNGAFSKFEEKSFLSLLERERHRAKDCLFVTLPDVVGSAIRTGECYRRWRAKNAFALEGYKLALAAQDGLECMEMMPTWDEFHALFIGGTDAFKCSRGAEQLIKAAKILGKWVHVGRVNSPDRYEWAESLGVDSVDGTGLSRFSHMRAAIANRTAQAKLDYAS